MNEPLRTKTHPQPPAPWDAEIAFLTRCWNEACAMAAERGAELAQVAAQHAARLAEVEQRSSAFESAAFKALEERDDLRAQLATLQATVTARAQEIQQVEILLAQASQASMLNRRAYLEEHDKLVAAEAEITRLKGERV